MSAMIEVKLKKLYMNIPKGATIWVTADKADQLVKIKTASYVDKKPVTYSEKEVTSIKSEHVKEVVKLNAEFDRLKSAIADMTDTVSELNETIKQKHREILNLESKVNKYKTAYEDADNSKPANADKPATNTKAVGGQPKDKMLKGAPVTK